MKKGEGIGAIAAGDVFNRLCSDFVLIVYSVSHSASVFGGISGTLCAGFPQTESGRKRSGCRSSSQDRRIDKNCPG